MFCLVWSHRLVLLLLPSGSRDGGRRRRHFHFSNARVLLLLLEGSGGLGGGGTGDEEHKRETAPSKRTSQPVSFKTMNTELRVIFQLNPGLTDVLKHL